ncbi:NAD(P)/FAD-dependent oxidoreductase [Candidatus Uabimicrobium amorphum]|uniref:HI0933 family flavoprotein YhiN n=1 Tax=Uabimicrobium amorphum TaxID=2596890 RepID=A0A5S9IUR3_UABAM|nr:aminoacetone oxidase family FAD-binding enzyme [Candidatus Uabimicrobium amorphum]BBM88284.1 HI0933 family flavoprotein YhiN [Candidatus Uabimicrobium amorphum]
MTKYTTIIIGAGAAGMMTAIAAASHGAKHILVVNATPRLGLKILMSGGGRCNITNAKLQYPKFYGASQNAIKKIIKQFPPQKVIDFFEEEGLKTKIEEPWYKYFPVDNKAKSVLDTLLNKLKKLHVQIEYPVVVDEFSFREGVWNVTAQDKQYCCDYLVIASGGFSYPHTGSDGKLWQNLQQMGIKMQKPIPALTPVKTQNILFHKLKGLSLPCQIMVKRQQKTVQQEHNSVLFTHFGLSGPGILNISHWFTQQNTDTTLVLNFLPEYQRDVFEKELMQQPHNTKIVNFLHKFFQRRLGETLVAMSCSLEQTVGQLTKKQRKSLLNNIFAQNFQVTDTLGYKKAEVTSGGVEFSELDLKTMELKNFPQLYVVGEIVNVHGDIGGYNFQWAWSSGWVCGKAIASKSF